MPRKAPTKKPNILNPTGKGEGGALKTQNILINGTHIKDLCAWVPDEERQADFAMENGTLSQMAPQLLTSNREDTHLWMPLTDHVLPTWRRGAQGIGDCVSWGAELCATMAMAIQHVQGMGRFIAEAATEPIYGGCRVECLGKRAGGFSDGAFGAAAARWLRDWGAILRLDMRNLADNPEYDLRKYDKNKAKQWGNYGCGGQNDNGIMDGAARNMPVQQVVQIKTLEDCIAALLNGYTVSIASMAGFGRMVRNAHGICKIVDRWAHQMMLGGVRFRGGEALFRTFQSWGKSCSGPDPGITNPAVSHCSWWTDSRDMESIIRSGDCWAFADVAGLPKRTIHWIRAASQWQHKPAETDHSYSLGV
jgi:hypothetical protein